MKKYVVFVNRPRLMGLSLMEIAFVIAMIIAITKLSIDIKKMKKEEAQLVLQETE